MSPTETLFAAVSALARIDAPAGATEFPLAVHVRATHPTRPFALGVTVAGTAVTGEGATLDDAARQLLSRIRAAREAVQAAAAKVAATEAAHLAAIDKALAG